MNTKPIEISLIDPWVIPFISHLFIFYNYHCLYYTIPLLEETMNEYYGAREFTKSMKEYHANEELMFSIQNGEIESFLAERNLKMIKYMDNGAIERKYLMDDKGSLIGPITGNFRFVCASPMENLRDQVV